jgi:hypothetical protein
MGAVYRGNNNADIVQPFMTLHSLLIAAKEEEK